MTKASPTNIAVAYMKGWLYRIPSTVIEFYHLYTNVLAAPAKIIAANKVYMNDLETSSEPIFYYQNFILFKTIF